MSVFRACPAQFKYKFIDKLPEPKSPAMQRGNDLHKDLDAYLKKDKKTVPAVLKATIHPLVLEEYKLYRASKTMASELQLAVTNEWTRTGWFDKDVWLRVVLDVVRVDGKVLIMGDHKTGQIRPDQHAEQLEIYGAIGPAFWPGMSEIRGEMYYVDQNAAPAVHVYKPKDVPRLRKKWSALAAPMFKAKTFKAVPGQACRYCAFSGRRGGLCDKG